MSDEINPKPRFSYYRPSGEEGEAPLPAGTCCREGADGRHRSRHSGGSIRIPAIPCIDLGVWALPPQSLSRVRPKAAVFVGAMALSLNQRVQASSPCAPTIKFSEMNRIQRRLRAVAGLPFLCPPYVRNQG